MSFFPSSFLLDVMNNTNSISLIDIYMVKISHFTDLHLLSSFDVQSY